MTAATGQPEPARDTTDIVAADLLRAFDEAGQACWMHRDHGHHYSRCCERAGLAAALKLHAQQIRAEQPPLSPEYGVRVVELGGRTYEAALGGDADYVRAQIAKFDAQNRTGATREPLQRKVSGWTKWDPDE